MDVNTFRILLDKSYKQGYEYGYKKGKQAWRFFPSCLIWIIIIVCFVLYELGYKLIRVVG